MTPEEVARLASSLFADGGALQGRYKPSQTAFDRVTGGGAGWQSHVFPVGSAAPRVIRVYPLAKDGGDLVRAHWRNETRALLRLSSTEHPSLPRFREGAYLDDQRLGYVIIDDVGTPVMGPHPVAGVLRRSALAAFRRWFALLEATMLLQDEGLIHRSISPMTACALEDEDASIVLDGFQMSAFISAWLMGGSVEASWQGALEGATLACLAPERVGPLLGQPRRLAEGLRSDVFGLGMLGTPWFAPPPTEWGAGFDAKTYTEAAHRELVADARARLARSPVPRPLRSLLASMTEFAPANRIPGARVAYEEGAKVYGSILRALSEREVGDAAPRQLYFLKETIARLYADNRASSSTEHPVYEEYNEYIGRDLDAGTVVWSADGFTPWETSSSDARAGQARIVLLGREYAYFAQLSTTTGRPDETDRALVIKYPPPRAQGARPRKFAQGRPASRGGPAVLRRGVLRAPGPRRAFVGLPSLPRSARTRHTF